MKDCWWRPRAGERPRRSRKGISFDCTFVVVNGLAFVVVFRAEGAAFGCDGLGSFVGFEAAEEFFFSFRADYVAESAVAQHPGIVHLDVLWVHRVYLVKRVDCL